MSILSKMRSLALHSSSSIGRLSNRRFASDRCLSNVFVSYRLLDSKGSKMTESVSIPMETLARAHSTSSVNRMQVRKDSATEPHLVAKIKEKPSFKILLRDYGATGIIFYISLALCTYLISCLLFLTVIPHESAIRLISQVEFLSKYAENIEKYGIYGIAYVCYKLTMLPRLAITSWALPRLVRYLRMKKILK